MIEVIIESYYYREQFEDWLAWGKVVYKDKSNYWEAYDSNNGFGWTIKQVHEEDWNKISNKNLDRIVNLIAKSLRSYRNKFVF